MVFFGQSRIIPPRNEKKNEDTTTQRNQLTNIELEYSIECVHREQTELEFMLTTPKGTRPEEDAIRVFFSVLFICSMVVWGLGSVLMCVCFCVCVWHYLGP